MLRIFAERIALRKGRQITRFTEKLSTQAKKLISDEDHPFAKNISVAVMLVVISIVQSNSMELSVAEVNEMAIPVSQFLGTEGVESEP